MLSEDQDWQTPRGKSKLSSVFRNKFYLNVAMFVQVSVGCGCFCTSKAELSNCNRDQMTCKTKKKKKSTMWPFTLLIP